ncbi:MAG: fumarylacetoacetate hydrolase family protein [Verrucomicrobiota bacterium]
MKIIRFLDGEGETHYGIPQHDNAAQVLSGDIFQKIEPTGLTTKVHRLLAPVVPSQILCIGLNYKQHAAEVGARIPKAPVLFMKAPTALNHPGAPIQLPRSLRSDEVDYECELAVVIGKRGKNISRADACHYILGYTCANDVSARDWQLRRSGHQWCRAKSFDTFCPLGPQIITADELPDPHDLEIRTEVNGELLQQSNTADMIFDVPSIIEFLSGSTTLTPGTVILTGTPGGVGMGRNPQRWLRPGDIVSVTIDQIGTLTSPVTEEK